MLFRNENWVSTWKYMMRMACGHWQRSDASTAIYIYIYRRAHLDNRWVWVIWICYLFLGTFHISHFWLFRWNESIFFESVCRSRTEWTNASGGNWNRSCLTPGRSRRGVGWIMNGCDLFAVFLGILFRGYNMGIGGRWPGHIFQCGTWCKFHGSSLLRWQLEIFNWLNSSVHL